MSEPTRVQIVRPHQNVTDFVFRVENRSDHDESQSVASYGKDYDKIAKDNITRIQKLPWKEKWPIFLTNVIPAATSGILAGAIGRKIAKNLALGTTTNLFGTSAGPFFFAASSHLLAYIHFTVKPLCSDNPMVCPTCLEIRSFTIGTAFPVLLGTSASILGNLSPVINYKVLRLPPFTLSAYKEWLYFFERHAFKGMAHRHFLFYPLLNGFFTSLAFAGQSYYWHHYLRDRFNDEKSSSSLLTKH